MQARILVIACGLAVALLGLIVGRQASRIARLETKLEALDQRLEQARPDSADGDGDPAQAVRVPPPTAAAMPALARPTAVPPAPPVPAVRVPVTQAEVATVESAVLKLLDEDHPELRAKLRAVVQEQQQTLEQEQHEQRRELWIARREAMLRELGDEVGLSAEQREQIMGIVLATRDQIAELRQGGLKVPEAFEPMRDKIRALREQAGTQIRGLLKPEQYEAYRARFGDDDERRRPERPERPEP